MKRQSMAIVTATRIEDVGTSRFEVTPQQLLTSATVPGSLLTTRRPPDPITAPKLGKKAPSDYRNYLNAGVGFRYPGRCDKRLHRAVSPVLESSALMLMTLSIAAS